MSAYYPRIKSVKSHLLILERQLTESEVRRLGALELGTGQFVYTFDCEESDLSNVYIAISDALEDDNARFMAFKITGNKVVY